MQVCEKSGLKLKRSGTGIWVIGDPGTAMPTQLHGEAAKKLREAPKQQYDFAKAHAADVLRFLATDAGMKFVGLSTELIWPSQELTFSIKDSPFAVLEALSSILGIEWTPMGETWHVHAGARGEPKQQKQPKSSSGGSASTTELERIKTKLSSLPTGGRRDDESGKTTAIMLGDMILRPGGHVPALETNQTGRLRVKSIGKQQITFLWSEQGKEEVTFDLPLLEKLLLGQ